MDPKIGFEVDAELILKKGGKEYRQPFPIKVNSLNPLDIQPVINYWKDYLKSHGDDRKIIVNAVYRIEKISGNYE